MLINLKIHFTLFILKYGSCIECHRRLRNITYISAGRYLLACFGNLIWPRAIICIHDVFTDRYTHCVSHNRELYAWKRARARVYSRSPRVGNQFLDLTNFGGTHTYVDTRMYDFLLISFGENNAFSVKISTAMYNIAYIHSTYERRLARDQNADVELNYKNKCNTKTPNVLRLDDFCTKETKCFYDKVEKFIVTVIM